jgi:hypothetical protein
MDDSEMQSLVSGMISAATQYVDGELSPERALATDYYFGRKVGVLAAQKGRSSAVLTEVRDGVQAVLPSLLRVIFGPEHAVEFVPRSAEDVDAALLKTDYVRFVFEEDNAGFLNTLAVLKDGLVKKLGVFKWGWDDTTEVTNYKLDNLSGEQLEALAMDDEVEITRIEQRDDELFDIEVKRTQKSGRATLFPVPPEEFLHNREARSLDEALFVAHRTHKPRGELIAMGIDPKLIDEHGGLDSDLQDSEEQIARMPNGITGEHEDLGEANDKILYVESYVRLDFDGDGIAERRMICTIGPSHYPVVNEPCDDIPFAIFCPDPEPHTLLGQSWADRLMDMQDIKSALMRGGLDSLAASLFPRTWYKEGDANMHDVLNPAIGAPIRTKSGAAAVGEFAHTFVGKEAFTVLQYCDDVVERRTGQNKGAQGIDADALQSSTKTAVAAAVTASQAQQEMLARIFAEGTLKRVFRGLLRLLVKHQPRARVTKLRGNWVEIDPRVWDADMDVQCNVILGAGLAEEKIATLREVAEIQGAILEKLGQENPIVSLKEYRDTLAQIVEMRGFKNSGKFFKPITEKQLNEMRAAAANQPPPETPEMVLAKAQIQIEQMKAQAKIATDKMNAERDLLKTRMELELKRREIMLEDDRQRDKQAADAIIKLRDIEATTGVSQANAIQQIEDARKSAMRSPEEIAPRKKRVKFERDGNNRLAGATVEYEDESY